MLIINGSVDHQLPDKKGTLVVISQQRLARIQELQSRLAYEQTELTEEMKRLRKDVIDGAEVEDGPFRAWLRFSMRMIRKRGSKTRVPITATTLILR